MRRYLDPTPVRLARNVLLLGSLALLSLAGSAAALPSLPALPAAPSLPAIDQGVATPVGGAHVRIADGHIQACADAQASTAVLQAVPIPALPVPAAIPHASAKADACIEAGVGELPRLKASATTPLGGARARFQDGNLDACTDAKADTHMVPALPVQAPVPVPQGSLGAEACAGTNGTDAKADTSLLQNILNWIQSLL
jgi:hypothetical protein